MIEVTRETRSQIAEMGWIGKLVERCSDCNKRTRYWANDGEFPLCQECCDARNLKEARGDD